MTLLVKGLKKGKEIVAVTPDLAKWSFVGFTAYRLTKGERVSFDTKKM